MVDYLNYQGIELAKALYYINSINKEVNTIINKQTKQNNNKNNRSTGA